MSKFLVFIPQPFFVSVADANCRPALNQPHLEMRHINFKLVRSVVLLENYATRGYAFAVRHEDIERFPVDAPLSYEFEDGTLTIGRDEICDACLHLSGALRNGTAAGEYFQFGWGRKQRGYFSLRCASR